MAAARQRLGELSLTPAAASSHGLRVNQDGARRSALELLAYRGVTVGRLAAVWPELADLRADVAGQLETEARASRTSGGRRPTSTPSAARRASPCRRTSTSPGSGLTTELRQALSRVRPTTVGAASRISGMTPAALVLLYRHARRAA